MSSATPAACNRARRSVSAASASTTDPLAPTAPSAAAVASPRPRHARARDRNGSRASRAAFAGEVPSCAALAAPPWGRPARLRGHVCEPTASEATASTSAPIRAPGCGSCRLHRECWRAAARASSSARWAFARSAPNGLDRVRDLAPVQRPLGSDAAPVGDVDRMAEPVLRGVHRVDDGTGRAEDARDRCRDLLGEADGHVGGVADPLRLGREPTGLGADPAAARRAAVVRSSARRAATKHPAAAPSTSTVNATTTWPGQRRDPRGPVGPAGVARPGTSVARRPRARPTTPSATAPGPEPACPPTFPPAERGRDRPRREPDASSARSPRGPLRA